MRALMVQHWNRVKGEEYLKVESTGFNGKYVLLILIP